MSKEFKVKVSDSHLFELNSDELNGFNIVEKSENQLHLIHNNKSYKIEIVNSEFNKKLYKVSVNNKYYNTLIINYLDLLIEEMGFSVGASKNVDSVVAPMPGLILDILIKEGDEIKENDSLLILEAMKMENILVSPRDGVIKSVKVVKGNNVDKNDLLIEFE